MLLIFCSVTVTNMCIVFSTTLPGDRAVRSNKFDLNYSNGLIIGDLSLLMSVIKTFLKTLSF
jgi:hypothetical protein